MSALKSLMDEHQVIVELLGALHTYATRLRGGVAVDPADLGRFAEVFRELVDYRHHEKEEGILLPLLARNGFEWSSGMLADLRREHGHLRYLIDVLCQLAAKDAAGAEEEAAGAEEEAAGDEEAGSALELAVPGRVLGSSEERRRVAEAALAFVEVERRHIQREERELFVAIRERLAASALVQLGAELAQFDEVTGRHAGSAPLFEAAADLVQRYAEGSGTVDVTGVDWTVAPADQALRRVS